MQVPTKILPIVHEHLQNKRVPCLKIKQQQSLSKREFNLLRTVYTQTQYDRAVFSFCLEYIKQHGSLTYHMAGAEDSIDTHLKKLSHYSFGNLSINEIQACVNRYLAFLEKASINTTSSVKPSKLKHEICEVLSIDYSIRNIKNLLIKARYKGPSDWQVIRRYYRRIYRHFAYRRPTERIIHAMQNQDFNDIYHTLRHYSLSTRDKTELLYAAVSYDYPNVVKYLLAGGAKLDGTIRGKYISPYNMSVLAYGLRFGNHRSVAILLKNYEKVPDYFYDNIDASLAYYHHDLTKLIIKTALQNNKQLVISDKTLEIRYRKLKIEVETYLIITRNQAATLKNLSEPDTTNIQKNLYKLSTVIESTTIEYIIAKRIIAKLYNDILNKNQLFDRIRIIMSHVYKLKLDKNEKFNLIKVLENELPSYELASILQSDTQNGNLNIKKISNTIVEYAKQRAWNFFTVERAILHLPPIYNKEQQRLIITSVKDCYRNKFKQELNKLIAEDTSGMIKFYYGSLSLDNIQTKIKYKVVKNTYNFGWFGSRKSSNSRWCWRNYKTYEESPLLLAIRANNLVMLEFLLKNGANPMVRQNGIMLIESIIEIYGIKKVEKILPYIPMKSHKTIQRYIARAKEAGVNLKLPSLYQFQQDASQVSLDSTSYNPRSMLGKKGTNR